MGATRCILSVVALSSLNQAVFAQGSTDHENDPRSSERGLVFFSETGRGTLTTSAWGGQFRGWLICAWAAASRAIGTR
jgi:hypothetical protein